MKYLYRSKGSKAEIALTSCSITRIICCFSLQVTEDSKKINAGSARNLGLNLTIHRVVNRNGLLTGKHHYDSPTHMQELLENEEIMSEDDQVQDFNKLL